VPYLLTLKTLHPLGIILHFRSLLLCPINPISQFN
jgi:hypothetical protein